MKLLVIILLSTPYLLHAQSFETLSERFATSHPISDQVRLIEQSSSDKTNQNNDGFVGGLLSPPFHTCRWRDSLNSDYVLSSIKSHQKGALIYTHRALYSEVPYNEKVRIYSDNPITPKHNISLIDMYVSQTDTVFSRPFVDPDWIYSGGFNSYSIVPFDSSFSIKASWLTADTSKYWHPSVFHIFRYIKGHQPSWGNWKAFMNRAGSNPHPPASNIQNNSIVISPVLNKVYDVLEHSGKGSITNISVQVSDSKLFNDIWIKIHFDSLNTVTCPLGGIFGAFNSIYPIKNSSFFFMDKSFGSSFVDSAECWFPMPFKNNFKIEIINKGYSGNGLINFNVSIKDGKYPEPWGYFTAAYNESLPTHTNYDHIFMQIDGEEKLAESNVGKKGKIIAVILETIADSLKATSTGNTFPESRYLEGDHRVDIDGSIMQHRGTGGEEFFNWGWYDLPTDIEHSYPFSGYSGKQITINDTNKIIARSQYVVRALDAIPFYESIRLAIEHGDVNNENADYKSVTLSYVSESSGMDLLATVSVDDSLSKIYTSFTSIINSSHNVTKKYPGDSTYSQVSATVNEVSQTSMELIIPPDNEGIQIKLRHEPMGNGYREANVFVDNQYVGKWHIGDNNNFFWMDNYFDIPKSYTAGKVKVQLEIVPILGSPYQLGWNESEYVIKAYVDNDTKFKRFGRYNFYNNNPVKIATRTFVQANNDTTYSLLCLNPPQNTQGYLILSDKKLNQGNVIESSTIYVPTNEIYKTTVVNTNRKWIEVPIRKLSEGKYYAQFVWMDKTNGNIKTWTSNALEIR